MGSIEDLLTQTTRDRDTAISSLVTVQKDLDARNATINDLQSQI